MIIMTHTHAFFVFTHEFDIGLMIVATPMWWFLMVDCHKRKHGATHDQIHKSPSFDIAQDF